METLEPDGDRSLMTVSAAVKPRPPGSVPTRKAERHRRWWIPLLWLLAALGCGWIVATTPVTADLSAFVPRGDPVADLLLEQLRNGPTTRLSPIGLAGDSEAARATVSRVWPSGCGPAASSSRVANGADALPEAELQALFAHRYPLSPTVSPERFTAEGLRAALEQRLAELQSPLAVFQKRWLAGDPTGELLTLLQQWRGGLREPAKRLGVWFSPDGARALLLAETRASGYDLAGQHEGGDRDSRGVRRRRCWNWRATGDERSRRAGDAGRGSGARRGGTAQRAGHGGDGA